MNLNEECLLKYLQNPDEIFDLTTLVTELKNTTGFPGITTISDVMLQHVLT